MDMKQKACSKAGWSLDFVISGYQLKKVWLVFQLKCQLNVISEWCMRCHPPVHEGESFRLTWITNDISGSLALIYDIQFYTQIIFICFKS